MNSKFFTLVTLFMIMFSGLAMAQTTFMDEKGFSFQSYAVDADGKPIDNGTVDVKFTIYRAGQVTPDYEEIQQATTDAFGVFNLVIGITYPSSFVALDFLNNNYKLKVQVKKQTATNFTVISDSWMLAVPYAQAATTAVTALNGAPVGSIMPYAGGTVPAGWLLCDGGTYAKTAYPSLFTAIGTAWGSSGANFNVPDLRGQFLRGVSGTTNVDPDKTSRTNYYTGGNTGNSVGTYQFDATAMSNSAFYTGSGGNHTHSGTTSSDGWGRDAEVVSSGSGAVVADDKNTHSHTLYINAAGDHTHSIYGGDNETRPTNAAVNFIIKY